MKKAVNVSHRPRNYNIMLSPTGRIWYLRILTSRVSATMPPNHPIAAPVDHERLNLDDLRRNLSLSQALRNW